MVGWSLGPLVRKISAYTCFLAGDAREQAIWELPETFLLKNPSREVSPRPLSFDSKH